MAADQFFFWMVKISRRFLEKGAYLFWAIIYDTDDFHKESFLSTMATMNSALVSNYENEHIFYIECFHWQNKKELNAAQLVEKDLSLFCNSQQWAVD
jgi:hypothetical protein